MTLPGANGLTVPTEGAFERLRVRSLGRQTVGRPRPRTCHRQSRQRQSLRYHAQRRNDLRKPDGRRIRHRGGHQLNSARATAKLHAFEMNLNLRIIHPKAIANLLF